MKQYPVDIQYECRGKSVDWFSIDNSNFAKYEADIQYRFNDCGFRMDIDMPDIKPFQPLYIGDSTTMGFGINVEDSWSYKHHKKHHSESQYINLAVASGSIDTTARLLDHWVPILEPSEVYFLENAGNRQEFIGQDGIASVIGVWRSISTQKKYGNVFDDETIFLGEVFDRYVSSETSLLVNKQKNLNAIRWITKNLDLHYCIHSPWNEKYFGGSRDGFHSSPEQHDNLLNWFEENEVII